nr:MAG TPA: hypothetical protein [Caudoviricetes sp.]
MRAQTPHKGARQAAGGILPGNRNRSKRIQKPHRQ